MLCLGAGSLVGSGVGKSGFSLLQDGSLDSLSPGKGDKGLGALSDDEDVVCTGGEGVSSSVSDVGNVERSRVLLL